jgi:hypothetical protein
MTLTTQILKPWMLCVPSTQQLAHSSLPSHLPYLTTLAHLALEMGVRQDADCDVHPLVRSVVACPGEHREAY